MRISRTNAVGVVVDFQERLVPHMQNNDETVENCAKLIKGLTILGVPVLVTQQYTRGLGETVEAIKAVSENFSSIEKTSFSCADEPEFAKQLEKSGKKIVIVAGIEAHVCVLQTVLDLKEAAYVPVVVEDCISSRNKNDKRIALKRFKAEGILVTTYESVLFELLRTAKAEEFKAISNLVK